MGPFAPIPVCAKTSLPLQGEPLPPLQSNDLLPIRDTVTRRYLNGLYGVLPEPLTRDVFSASQQLADRQFPAHLGDTPAYEAARLNLIHLANLNGLLSREILPQHVPSALNQAAQTIARQTAPLLDTLQKRKRQLAEAQHAYDTRLEAAAEQTARQLLKNTRLDYSTEAYPRG